MKVIVKETYASASALAADMVLQQIQQEPRSVLSVPTGGTPIGCYEEMSRRAQEEHIDFSGLTFFNMDEYAGMRRDDPNGYYYFLNDHLYRHTNVKPENTHCPDVCAPDLEAECQRYTRQIEQAGGLDLILLGIGRDGHIAFNMPGDALTPDAHVEHLSRETIEDNSRFFAKEEDVPTRAVSIGVGVILSARRIVVLVSGENKADIVSDLMQRRVTTQNPASLLWLHPDVTLILDEAAASKL
jgi:glucosamine-6-phosphate deaminase